MNELLTDLREIKVTDTNLKVFIVMVGGILYYVTRNQTRNVHLVIVFITFIVFIFPKSIRPFYKIWMGISMCIGLVMSTIFLSILFVVSIIPIGILMRVVGKKPLDLSFKTKNPSYWTDRKNVPREKYLNQY